MSIRENFQLVKRADEIFLVLFEEGLGWILDELKISHRIPFFKKMKPYKGKALKPEVRLRAAFERLGPTFIKLGQLLSVRPDLIPKEYVHELEKLLDEVPPIPSSQAKKIVEQELGKPIHSAFKSFDDMPIASASISQVHKAVLKNGQTVAVKVQRPDIKQMMERDIKILFYIAGLMEKRSEKLKRFKPIRTVKEFAEWTGKELDFRLEARHARRFAAQFKDSKIVKIPKVYEDLTTDKLLVMEFIDGIELNKINEIKKRKYDFHKIVENGTDAIFEQVFVHGFFHADPHPANILITPDQKISFVDFGIVGYFDEQLKRKCVDLLYGIINDDAERMIEVFTSMQSNNDYDKAAFRRDLEDSILAISDLSLNEVKVSKVLEDVFDVISKYGVSLPREFVLFGKTIYTLEGVALKYDPKMRFVEVVKPVVNRIARKTAIRSSFKDLKGTARKLRDFAVQIPDQAQRVLKTLEAGEIKIDVNDTDIKRLALELDRSSDRLTYGMIISALLVSSAIVITLEPRIYSISLFSTIGFILAIIMTIILVVSIAHQKEHTI